MNSLWTTLLPKTLPALLCERRRSCRTVGGHDILVNTHGHLRKNTKSATPNAFPKRSARCLTPARLPPEHTDPLWLRKSWQSLLHNRARWPSTALWAMEGTRKRFCRGCFLEEKSSDLTRTRSNYPPPRLGCALSVSGRRSSTRSAEILQGSGRCSPKTVLAEQM